MHASGGFQGVPAVIPGRRKASPGHIKCRRPYALSTEAGSTFTPGPIVEEIAMRWM